MLRTEAEARKTMCQEMTCAGKAADDIHSDLFCIVCEGVDCMAWRWHDLNCERIKPENRRGYCGKVGEPAALK